MRHCSASLSPRNRASFQSIRFGGGTLRRRLEMTLFNWENGFRLLRGWGGISALREAWVW
jgi:hypothetical protein